MSKNYIYEINNFFIDLRDISIIHPFKIEEYVGTMAAEGWFDIKMKQPENNITLKWGANYQNKGFSEENRKTAYNNLFKIIVDKRENLIKSWMEAINNQ